MIKIYKKYKNIYEIEKEFNLCHTTAVKWVNSGIKPKKIKDDIYLVREVNNKFNYDYALNNLNEYSIHDIYYYFKDKNKRKVLRKLKLQNENNK